MEWGHLLISLLTSCKCIGQYLPTFKSPESVTQKTGDAPRAERPENMGPDSAAKPKAIL